MSKSHEQVIKGFRNGKEYRGHNVFARDGVLYSYGTHFALAVKRDGSDNLRDGKEWFLLNGDKYSSSTSQHQAITYSVFREYPRVSFTALYAAGLCPHSVDVVDWWQDESKYVHSYYPEDQAEFESFKEHMPVGAEYHERRNAETGEVTEKSYHRIGSVVLKRDGVCYLCSMDEGSYFVSKLPIVVNTVDEAFECLKPDIVKQAIINKMDVKRQGEWFFIPLSALPEESLFPGMKPEPRVKERDFLKSVALPSADSQTNRHVVTRLREGMDGTLFVKGWVRHRGPDNRRADHRPINLGNELHIAVVNTATGNWSAGGKVD